MIHLALQTEYSFKKSFLHIKDIHKYVVDGYVGVADLNNTFSHIPLQREAEKHGFKPIFGVRLHVIEDGSTQRTCNSSYVFIAKSNKGLKELYGLVTKAYDNFYYFPRLLKTHLDDVSEEIVIIEPFYKKGSISDFFAIGQGYTEGVTDGRGIAVDQNNFPEREDREVYELLAGARKNGESYSYFFQDQTYPQHIMSREDWLLEYKNTMAADRTRSIAQKCKATIQKAKMVQWSGGKTLRESLNMDKVKHWNKEYKTRLEYEINMIENKDYTDYFLIVADIIKNSKEKMLVGPARGSSAGSLVCYLLDITEVDPIEHKLIFERFIDINRFDLPDIDIDFPDTKRQGVIKYIKHKYGRDKVMCLANVNRLKAKSAIGEFAKGLGIPAYETTGVKDSLIERSPGDARAAMCIADTFKTTDAGKQFIEQYPAMALVERIEDHASHAGKHAAGILVSTLPLCNYGSLNTRDEIIQMDKKDAEYVNLLKVDCLGLRNLSILEGVADQIGKPYDFYYTLPLDDAKTYELFNSMRLSGVFQFDGPSLQQIVKQMGVRSFGDITAITALARPGALGSGGTARYIKYVTGKESPTFYSDAHRDITGDTFGIVVYQEQMMEIARRVGGMSWEDVSFLRKATSKSMGDEYINKFKKKFIEGTIENGIEALDAEVLWEDVASSGSYSFNKSHAVGYGLVSYWTAWAKAHYPLEFAVASLNNTADDNSAKRLLRDIVINEGVSYKAVNKELSEMNWSTKKGELVGGLINIKGVGKVKANQILKARKNNTPLPVGLKRIMQSPVTPFDILFPAKHYWSFLYNDPKSYGISSKPMSIIDVDGRGEYIFIGCITEKVIKDMNSQAAVEKRGGEYLEGNSTYLRMKMEDDTDAVQCIIDRTKFQSIGKDIAENSRLEKDWYIVKGKIFSDWRGVNITEIDYLNDYFEVKIE